MDTATRRGSADNKAAAINRGSADVKGTASNKAAAINKNTADNIQPFLSLLVPIYNVEAYLKQALDSLCSQTFSDFEVLCIDDGSTDNSRAIIEAYVKDDKRFRLLAKPNSGYGASLNRGLSEARGVYVGILEPDDFFAPDALETLTTAAKKHQADIVKANYWFFWSTPTEKNKLISVVPCSCANRVVDAQSEPSLLLANPSLWSGIYRREFLLKSEARFLETPGASFQDLGFSFKVFACAERIFCLNDAVLHYRQDNENSSVNNPEKTFCVCTEFDSIEEFIDACPERTWLRPWAFRLRYDSYLWNFERLNERLRPQFVKRMQTDFLTGVARGDYNPELFGSWQRKNFERILNNPERFIATYPIHPSPPAKALYYLKLGGPRLLFDAWKA